MHCYRCISSAPSAAVRRACMNARARSSAVLTSCSVAWVGARHCTLPSVVRSAWQTAAKNMRTVLFLLWQIEDPDDGAGDWSLWRRRHADGCFGGGCSWSKVGV